MNRQEYIDACELEISRLYRDKKEYIDLSKQEEGFWVIVEKYDLMKQENSRLVDLCERIIAELKRIKG